MVFEASRTQHPTRPVGRTTVFGPPCPESSGWESRLDWCFPALLPQGGNGTRRGRTGCRALTVVRALLLGLWHALADLKLSAHAVRDLGFRRFCQLEPEQANVILAEGRIAAVDATAVQSPISTASPGPGQDMVQDRRPRLQPEDARRVPEPVRPTGPARPGPPANETAPSAPPQTHRPHTPQNPQRRVIPATKPQFRSRLVQGLADRLEKI